MSSKVTGPAIRYKHFEGRNDVRADRSDENLKGYEVLFEFKDDAQWRRYQKKINGMMESLSASPFHGVATQLFGKDASRPGPAGDDGKRFPQMSLSREQITFIAHHEDEVVKAVQAWRKTEPDAQFDKSFTAKMQAHDYVRKCQYMLRTQDAHGHDLFDVFDVNTEADSKTPVRDGRVTAHDIGRVDVGTHRDPDL